MDLYFDDDLDIDALFKGELTKPNAVNISHVFKDKLKDIDNAFIVDNKEAYCFKLNDFFSTNHNVPDKIFIHVGKDQLNKLIPDNVKRDLDTSIRTLEPTINEFWKFVTRNNHWPLRHFIHRWFEFRGHEENKYYHQAIEVLNEFITYQKKNKPDDFAVDLNNLAYDYYLLQDYEKACEFFREASDMLKMKGDLFHYKNSLLNFWISKIEIIKTKEDIDLLEDEIKLFESENECKIEDLNRDKNASYWHFRKPFFLRAKIEEKKGNFCEAFLHQTQAVECQQTSKRLLEEDKAYLAKLEQLCKQLNEQSLPDT